MAATLAVSSTTPFVGNRRFLIVLSPIIVLAAGTLMAHLALPIPGVLWIDRSVHTAGV